MFTPKVHDHQDLYPFFVSALPALGSPVLTRTFLELTTSSMVKLVLSFTDTLYEYWP